MSLEIKNTTSVNDILLREVVDSETGVCYMVSNKGEAYDSSVIVTPMFDIDGRVKIDKEFRKENKK